MLENKSLPKNWEDTEAKANKVDIVDNVTTADSTKMLSANQGVILWSAIQAIADGGTFEALAKLAERYGKIIHTGVLNANELSIAVGKQLYNFELFIDGDRIDEAHFIANKKLGTINLTEAYADYDTTWVIVDEMDYRIKFSYPTMQLLQGTTDAFKATIEIDDVIEIQGGSVANDGDHRLVICKSTQGLNGVQIGTNKWLNEVPNTRIKTIVENVSGLETNKLGKTEKAVDSDKLDGQDSTYFAKQSDMTSANTQINQNKSDILSKAFNQQNVQTLFEKTGFSADMLGYYIGDTGTSNTDGKPNYTIGMSGIIDQSRGFQLAVSGDSPTIVFRRFHPNVPNGVTPWHEAFSTANCTSQKNPTGFFRFANGIIIQWGWSSSPPDNKVTVNMPLSFSNQDYKAFVTRNWQYHSPNDMAFPLINNLNGSTFYIYTGKATSNPTNVDMYTWIAIGW